MLIWVWFVQDLDVLPIVPAVAGRSRDDESGKTNSLTKLEKPFLGVPARDPPSDPVRLILLSCPLFYITASQPCPELLSNQQKRHKCLFAALLCLRFFDY